MKQRKTFEDKVERKAKVAERNSLREKRERAFQNTKYIVLDEDDSFNDTKAYSKNRHFATQSKS